MKTFSSFLIEKRRNPDKNPKIPAYKALEKYKDDEDVYISFTDIDKIGINPRSKFNTPLAIYTYPLKEIWGGFDHNAKHVKVPFAEKSPYIWVVKEKKEKFVKDLYSDYTSADFDRDMDQIEKLYGDQINFITISTASQYVFDISNIIIDSVLTPSSPEQFQVNMKEFAKKGHYDFVKKTLQMKPIEWETFVTKLNKRFEKLPDWKDVEVNPKARTSLSGRLQAKINNYNREFGGLDKIINAASHFAAVKSPAGSFWYVTRRVATLITAKDNFEIGDNFRMAKKDIIAWNKIFRELGYSGFADKSGKGIIHPAEPTQAIFLEKSAFKVIEKVSNINPRHVVSTPEDIMAIIASNNITISGHLIMSNDPSIYIDPKMGDGSWIQSKHISKILSSLLSKSIPYGVTEDGDYRLGMKMAFKYAKKLKDVDWEYVIDYLEGTMINIYSKDPFKKWFKLYKVDKKTQKYILAKIQQDNV